MKIDVNIIANVALHPCHTAAATEHTAAAIVSTVPIAVAVAVAALTDRQLQLEATRRSQPKIQRKFNQVFLPDFS